MRINRQTLLGLANDTVAQRVRQEHGILSAYLCGSLLGDNFLLGGCTDIDLVFIHIDSPPVEREIVRLTDEVHLDIAHYAQKDFREPRRLRQHAWLGPTISTCRLLHDPGHFMDFTQASVRGQFDRPEVILARARPLLEHARQLWVALAARQLAQPGPLDLAQYLHAVGHAANTIAVLSGPPLTERRFEVQEINQQFRKGDLTGALDSANRYLAKNPKDAQARFLKGLILAAQGKTNDAITVFTGLTEDYPELPEPYNNLAVLYASQSKYEAAKNALEMAIRTHPSYATAHENLGDIYAKMASLAYDKALALDSKNATAQTKLALIQDMMQGQPRKPAAAKPAASTAPKPVAKPAVAEATPATPAPANPAPTGNAIEATITRWAQAWSAEALIDAKRQGKVRFIGFTGHKDPKIHLKMLAHDFPFDTCQMPLNVFDGTYRSFEQEVLPVLTQRGIAPIGMKSLSGSAEPVKQGLVTPEKALR